MCDELSGVMRSGKTNSDNGRIVCPPSSDIPRHMIGRRHETEQGVKLSLDIMPPFDGSDVNVRKPEWLIRKIWRRTLDVMHR
jgi:hypothetical protein